MYWIPDGVDRYADEALWHERLLLHDLVNGSWVIQTLDEDMYVEDLSRADSLCICGPNRQLPRGIGNGESYRFGGPWYTDVELEALRDEARQLPLVVPGRGPSVDGQRVARRRVNEKGRVVYLVDNHESRDVIVAVEPAEQAEYPPERIPPRPSVEGVWVVISGGKFFGRILKHTSIRVEVDDLGGRSTLWNGCSRVSATAGEKHSDDDDNNETWSVFSVTAWGPVLLLAVQGCAKVMRVCCLFNETRRRRSVGATGSRFHG